VYQPTVVVVFASAAAAVGGSEALRRRQSALATLHEVISNRCRRGFPLSEHGEM
jgi:hypothetical protein